MASGIHQVSGEEGIRTVFERPGRCHDGQRKQSTLPKHRAESREPQLCEETVDVAKMKAPNRAPNG